MAYDDPGNWRQDDFAEHFQQLKKRCAAVLPAADFQHRQFAQSLANELGCSLAEVLNLGDEAYELV